jgi:hypothetical protein
MMNQNEWSIYLGLIIQERFSPPILTDEGKRQCSILPHLLHPDGK